MRKIRLILCLLAVTLSVGSLCSCGNEKEINKVDSTTAASEGVSSTEAEDTNNESKPSAVVGTTKAAATVEDNRKKLTAASVEIVKPPANKMRVNLNGNGANINLDTYWIPLTDYERGSAVSITLTSFPAVLQYDGKECTCTVVMEDGCETAEKFSQNTKESYIEAYGSQFESIEISGFEFMEIDSINSVKISGKVKLNGKESDMVHIISNCTSEKKTVSYMLLDSEGCRTDLINNFEDKIEYTSFFNGEMDKKREEMDKKREELHNMIEEAYNNRNSQN